MNTLPSFRQFWLSVGSVRTIEFNLGIGDRPDSESLFGSDRTDTVDGYGDAYAFIVSVCGQAYAFVPAIGKNAIASSPKLF